ncbi:hypothetical protein [Mycobacterium sp. 852002-51613_SCH5001154]|uniref:hypothetical protein n=1 Tax=Mycobacterium sp. 852002-51613_SCH5001154 TaxID=1834104 RepID=UPI000A938D30|nr:hypothetical protein [Mycobacterium sp. 852002-51613_SCH5001154]
MTTQTCMGCGLKTRYSYGRTCMGCGLQTRYSYGRCPDHAPRAAEALAALTRIVNLSGRHPTAALALTVPSVIIGLAAVAAYPFVFVPSLVLLSVALVASARYEEARNHPK